MTEQSLSLIHICLTSWQIFGCILSVAKLYDFDARKINQAIGVGCESSTLPTDYHATTMSDFYHYEHGYRARDGFLISKSCLLYTSV